MAHRGRARLERPDDSAAAGEKQLRPFQDVLGHVHHRRPAEAGRHGPRRRVPVLDRPGRLAVREQAARSVRQRQRQRLLALVVRVVERTPTSIVFVDSPAWNVSVPLAAV